MGRLVAAILLFVMIYGGVLAMFDAALGPAPEAMPLWYVWRALGALCLSSIAVEFTFFLTWLWLRRTDFSADGGVQRRLSAADRKELQERRPAVAMLMPAHNEASTPRDRHALAERIADILLKTPGYSAFFLLVDSPPAQRDNELNVVREVRRRLRAAGHEDYEDRLVLEEYREKPPGWRHKSGSILRWLQRQGARYEYMLILDADSSLPDEDPARPETCNVLERMVLAMLRDRSLALVQAAMHIRAWQTPWGWVQAVNARVGAAYYLRVFAYLYGRATPCYGHNCLMRVRDFARCARNTLMYTSHDHIDASDLAAAGRGCVLSDAVFTYEDPEDSVLLWLKRECRWSRGNGQWIVYLLKKQGLPLAPAVYLTLGIAQYAWALLAGLFFVATVAVISGEHRLLAAEGAIPARILVGFVVFVLVVPRYLACPTFREFAGSTTIGLVLSPALMLYQGFAFVLGAFGTRWVPRGARIDSFDWWQMMRIAVLFLPVMLLGLALWNLAADYRNSGEAGWFVQLMIVAMVISPITSVLVSWPWKRCREVAEDASPVLEPE